MTLETQMTLALLQELLMALGIEEPGKDVAGEVESDWMVPLLVEEEMDRLVAWEQGVRYEFNYFIGGLHDSL